jgi:TolA-binding protein
MMDENLGLFVTRKLCMRKDIMKRPILLVSLAITLLVTANSCLTTRAQLKSDNADGAESSASQPIPAQVQEVQPQGQYVIDEIKSELTRLTGRIEDLERENQQLKTLGVASKQDDLKKFETRITELEQAQAAMIDAIKKLQTGSPALDPAELFEKGKSEFLAGKYDAASDTLGNYLKSPGIKRAEEATFLRAEAFFVLKQYKKAIVDYSRFPEKFNRSKKMPVALLKIGLSFEAIGMKEDATGFFQELVDKFPKSPEAKKARAKLK